MTYIFNLFNVFNTQNAKIHPIGNRKRSTTDYHYKNILKNDFNKKKNNNNNSILRIRGTSF
jgi:hypothetical protein